MASVDDSIRQIDAQLITVGQKIRDCELAAVAVAKRDVSERDYYRCKENKLQDEKNKLLDEKNKLRDEKNMYLQQQLGEEAAKKQGIVDSRNFNALVTVCSGRFSPRAAWSALVG